MPHPGHKAVRSLQNELDTAWATMQRSTSEAKGKPNEKLLVAAALALFLAAAQEAIKDSYVDIWAAVAGNLGIETAITEAVKSGEFMDQFAEELDTEIDELGEGEDIDELLDNRKSRVLMYAGGAWLIYNVAKTHGKDEDELWQWDGADDESTCDDCAVEIALGARPLSDFTRYPGEVECLSNCRCEMSRV